jgi:hypothetical protein
VALLDYGLPWHLENFPFSMDWRQSRGKTLGWGFWKMLDWEKGAISLGILMQILMENLMIFLGNGGGKLRWIYWQSF